MKQIPSLALSLLVVLSACDPSDPIDPSDVPDAGSTLADAATDAPDAQVTACDTAEACAAAEQRAADELPAVAGDDTALTAFLKGMPKGGDLHMHLSGAVYAETYMQWARDEGGYCIRSSDLSLSYTCNSGVVAVPTPDQPLFMDVVRAWSMEGFVPGTTTGHDHFFSTFSKFGAISGPAHHAESLADVMVRADSENEVYLEPMLFSNSKARSLGGSVWSAKHGSAYLTPADFATFRSELMQDSGWNAAVEAIVTDVNATVDGAQNILNCGAPAYAKPACRVQSRFTVYISRSGKDPEVFAQMLAAYEAAMRDARVVALNLVGPEDNYSALTPYDRQMTMLEWLGTTYEGVSPLQLTLHAGELTSKYMPSGFDIGSINHIRKAVETAKARRIGHGLDVLSESNSQELMAQMRDKKVLVEACLFSNDMILEVRGSAHPLKSYLAAGVPVALATDDQAVSRSSITAEHVKAVKDHFLSYRELKAMARNSLEYSFLPGDSLWSDLGAAAPVAACAPPNTELPGSDSPSAACSQFLADNPKAATQWELEKRYRVFESGL